MQTHEIIVDNFAGGGGASTGIEIAISRSVDVAINHDPKAIAMHRANHPSTKHYIEDVFKVDPLEACEGRPVALAWFSPDCKHHSKAKGGKPVSKKIRGLAWVAIKWARAVRPRVIMLENVEEFMDWGRLDERCRPDPRYKGETFHRFVGQLEKQGYKVEYRVLRACDYGAPTIRKRFFLIARCDGQPIVWPEATLPLPTVTATDHNSLCAVSITQFNNHCDGQSVNTPMNTITAQSGHFAEVRAFLVKYYGNGDNAVPVSEPAPTVTAKDRMGLVTIAGQDYQIVDIGLRMLTPRELFNAQGFPEDYIIDVDADGNVYPKAEQVARCGNAVCPPIPTALVRANLPELCPTMNEEGREMQGASDSKIPRREMAAV